MKGIPLRQLIDMAATCQCELNGKWVPARGMTVYNFSLWRRAQCAWAVLTNKADAVVWPEDEA